MNQSTTKVFEHQDYITINTFINNRWPHHFDISEEQCDLLNINVIEEQVINDIFNILSKHIKNNVCKAIILSLYDYPKSEYNLYKYSNDINLHIKSVINSIENSKVIIFCLRSYLSTQLHLFLNPKLLRCELLSQDFTSLLFHNFHLFFRNVVYIDKNTKENDDVCNLIKI